MPAPADLWLKDTAYRGLLDDVIEHPDDDTPRLVMADWLEEHGDEVAQDRARFIRLQLERAKLSEHAPRAWELRGQERPLLRKHRSAWLGRLEKMTSKVVFHRGFPDEIVLGVAMLAKNADALFTLTPVRQLQVLRVSQTKLTMTDLASIDGLKRLRRLCLRGSNLGDDRVSELLSTVSLPHLEDLDLTACDVGDQTLTTLRKHPLPRLKSLNLGGNGFLGRFDQIQRALADYELEGLDLSGIAFERSDVDALAGWRGLSSLRRLALNAVSLGARGSTALFSSPHLGELQHLELTNAVVRIGGAAALARCAKLANLRHLDVSNAMIDHTGLDHLLDSPHLHHLESFAFGSYGMHGQHMSKLWSWPGLRSIRHLAAGYCFLGNQWLRELIAAPQLGALTSLEVPVTGLTKGWCEVLASSEKMRSLASMDVSGCYTNAADIQDVLAAPNLSGLQRFHFSVSHLPDAIQKQVDERYELA